MADQKVNIKVSTTGAKKAKDQLGGVTGAVTKMGKAVVTASAAYFGARGLIEGLTKSIDLAGKSDAIEKGFDNLAKKSGFSADAFKKFQDATNGTVGSLELMTQANNAMLLGITDSEDQMAEMFDVAQRLASALGQDTAFGVESLVTGLGRQSKLMLDNLGIMVDVEAANNNYANTLGITSTQLTDQQKKQAFVNESMRVAKELVAGLGEEQINTKDIANQLSAEMESLSIAIGRLLIPAIENLAPHIKGIIKFYTDLFNIQEKVNSRSSQKSFEQMNSLIKFQRDRLEGLNKSKLFEQRLTENGLALAKRATDQGRTVTEQYIHEKTELGKLIAEKANLIKKEQEELKIQEAMKTVHENKLRIRESDLELTYKLEAVTTPAIKSNRFYAESFGEIADASGVALRQTSDLLAATAGSSKSQQIQAMKLAQFAAIADTASGVMKAFKQGGTLGFITGAGIAATGAAQVATIQQAIANAQAAEFGFDGIVNKPTLFLTGEKNKAERVSVTPLESPNINGVQGGGMTLNITAPLIDEHILDTILPAIENAQKQNLA